MDPVSTALIAGATAGIASGLTAASKKLIVDAYDALKLLLKNKLVDAGDLTDAVEHLDKKPESKSRQGSVEEEVKNAQADEDTELLKAALALRKALEESPEGQQLLSKFQVTVQGDVGIIGDQTQIRGDFTVGGSKSDDQ